MTKLYVYGLEYETRPNWTKSVLELLRDGQVVGDIRRVGPFEFELTRGYYRINAGSIHDLAKREYQDYYGGGMPM